MNLERDDTNVILVTGRQVAGETHYLLKFVRVDDNTDARYCITTNTGSTTGPLLLEIDETDTPTAIDGEVELMAGDWALTVYGQGNGTNLNPASATRELWSELITTS